MDEDRRRLKEYQEVLRNIVSAFKNVPFPVVLESSVGHNVIPFDKGANAELLEDITFLAGELLHKHYIEYITRATYNQVVKKNPKQFRINDVSTVLERELVEARVPLKTVRQLKRLGAGGYPDCLIVDENGQTTYVDIKATTRRREEASARDFFFTGLEKTRQKVTRDGLHLLLGFMVKEVMPEQFKVVGWKLVDLSKLRVSLKPEFNASNPEIYKPEGIIAEKILERI